jgi:hypothetical protein
MCKNGICHHAGPQQLHTHGHHTSRIITKNSVHMLACSSIIRTHTGAPQEQRAQWRNRRRPADHPPHASDAGNRKNTLKTAHTLGCRNGMYGRTMKKGGLQQLGPRSSWPSSHHVARHGGGHPAVTTTGECSTQPPSSLLRMPHQT